MARGEVTDAQREAYETVKEHGGFRAAVKATGEPYSSLYAKYQRAVENGIEFSDGARNSVEQAGLGFGEAKGGHRRVYDEDGKQIDTVRWSVPPEQLTEEYLDRIARAFEDIPAAPPIVQSEKSAKGKIGFFPHSDVHTGIDVDADRGGRDYTPSIAEQRVRDGFAECHAAIPPCETAIILNNGDRTHANDDRDVTVKSQHRLKVKGSHRSNLNLVVNTTAWQIQAALERSERVIYRPNRGNHDPNTPDTLTIALKAYFRDNPRVTIDDSEREIWVYQRGLVMLTAWHGDKRKPEAVCADIPPNFPQQFGAARFWYGFTGHFHGPKQGVYGGIHWWQLPSVASMDQHSADAQYTDDAAMRAMMFCERGGLKHDMTVRF